MFGFSLSRIVFIVQKFILRLSYHIFNLFIQNSKPIEWVIGVDEIVGNIKYISESISNSYSVSLSNNKFYEYKYNFQLGQIKNPKFMLMKRALIGPIVLGYLLNRAKGFYYIFSTGFLLDNIDDREFEFSYVKLKGKKLVCGFVGADIRSTKLTLEFAQRNNIEMYASYHFMANKEHISNESNKIARAKVSEQYADLIFNSSVDQMSYFTNKTTPCMYYYPDRLFYKNNNKFSDIDTITMVHAPSAPIYKGTQLVRAAISRLKDEKYKFDYVEIVGKPNVVVLEVLRNAHIVLNEFYAMAPGLFGVEAMSSHCALITSADENIEPDLPSGSNNAWFVTKPYQVYDNLKLLLDNPDLMKKYADSGYKWALEHAALSSTGEKLNNILKKL